MDVYFLENLSLFPWQPKLIIHPVENAGVVFFPKDTHHPPFSHTPTLYKKRVIIMFNLCLQMFDLIQFDVAQGRSL